MTDKLDDKAEWTAVVVPLPPELKGYSPELQRFFDAMVYKLRRNAHKGKWETVPMETALRRLGSEMNELEYAVVSGSTSETMMEAADVANMALIVANISIEVRDAK